MPRGKRVVIEKRIKDSVVEKLRRYDPSHLEKKYNKSSESLTKSVARVYSLAKELYKKRVDEETIEETHKLFSVRTAYDYLRSHKIDISFRAFCGRLERGALTYVKIGRKRYIPKSVLDEIVEKSKDMYTVREAYEAYKKHNPNINFRAFIGRIEKGSLPSIKVGSRRYIPKEVIKAAVHVSNNYYTVGEALRELKANGIKINRNAFERRLDRRTIPHFKVGGRRFIHRSVLQELIEKEKALIK